MKSLVAAMLMTGMLASFAPSPASADSITFGYHTVRGDWDGDRGRRHDRDDRRDDDRRWSKDYDRGHARHGWWPPRHHYRHYAPMYAARPYTYPVYPQVIVRAAPQYWYYSSGY